jgi:hypothetical protein
MVTGSEYDMATSVSTHPDIKHRPLNAKQTYQYSQMYLSQVSAQLDQALQEVREENNRDNRRLKEDKKDRSFPKALAHAKVNAIVTPILVGAAAIATIITQDVINLDTWQNWLSVGLIGSAALAQANSQRHGHFGQKMSESDWMQKTGDHHHKRRVRAMAIEMESKVNFYEDIQGVRLANRVFGELPLGKIRLGQRRKLNKPIADLERKLQKIERFIDEMEQRDQIVKTFEESRDRASNAWRRRSSKREAREIFIAAGIGEHFGYFGDPERDLPDVVKTNAQAYQELTPLQQTCAEMRNELPDGPDWPALYDRLVDEIEQTEQIMASLRKPCKAKRRKRREILQRNVEANPSGATLGNLTPGRQVAPRIPDFEMA